MKKKCELCKKVARMYCDSDQASLCWDCDSRVHTANFLVSKHIRTLLCHACQCPTPWTGSGPKLGPTVSVCEACFTRRNRSVGADRSTESGSGNSEDEEDEDEDEDENEDDNDDDDDDGENQVVPLSLPPSTSASSEESSRTAFGSSNATTTSESSRFPYDEIGKSEEKNGTRKFRSWKWR